MRKLLTTASLGIALAFPAQADVLGDMTAADRDILHSEIRNYLLENPEIMLEVIDLLEKQRLEQAESRDTELLADNSDALLNDGYSFVAGNPDGDITIVEFFDYQCGYCKKAHPDVVELLSTDGNIRLIKKEFPILGPASEQASRAAIAVLMNDGADVYSTFSDSLMSHEGQLNEAVITKYAEDAGADIQAMATGAASDEVGEIVRKNRALGAALQVSGTPTFVFGDRIVRGYVPLSAMEQIVNELRQES